MHMPAGKWPLCRHIWAQSAFVVQDEPTVLLVGLTTVMSPHEASQAEATNRARRQRFMSGWCRGARRRLKRAPSALIPA